ncbi:hypothetical protein BaRGS_00014397 [Batillaria attramentaria]|uniref:Phytanoyl-CoA hydroxylase-interacting protein-like C-terminal domain-containing protein n=1 Tax=Batillaria attramentaria TaxID=370345 RepID=A0ABD0L415_9CAEN
MAAAHGERWPGATVTVHVISNDELTSPLVSASLTRSAQEADTSSSDQELSSLCSDLSLNGVAARKGSTCTESARPCSVDPIRTNTNRNVTFLPTVNCRYPISRASPEMFLCDVKYDEASGQNASNRQLPTESFVIAEGGKQSEDDLPYRLSCTDLDVSNMRQKLSAQKELLFRSFTSPPRMPAEFATQNNSGCLKIKLKDRLRKVGRAAKHFLHQNIIKRQQTRLQRCEIQLAALPEDADQVFLTISRANKALATVSVGLQHHNPSYALTGQMQSRIKSACTQEVTHTPPLSYKFGVMPNPIAIDFTELLVLQRAEPFQEFFSLSSSTCEQPAVNTANLVPAKYYAASSYRLTKGESSGVFVIHSATSPVFFKACMDKAAKAELCRKAAELSKVKDKLHASPLPAPQLLLAKPPDFDIENFLKACHEKQVDTMRNLLSEIKSQKTPAAAAKFAPAASSSLHFSVWEGESGLQSHWSAGESCDHIEVPSLTVYNMNTRLYFADFWDCYGKSNVMLVLCSKGSPAEEFCKQNLCKLDPYNNPFLFRKRVLFPEASVQVYAARNVNLEILYTDAADVKQHTLFCSKNLYFSKVKVLAG